MLGDLPFSREPALEQPDPIDTHQHDQQDEPAELQHHGHHISEPRSQNLPEGLRGRRHGLDPDQIAHEAGEAEDDEQGGQGRLGQATAMKS